VDHDLPTISETGADWVACATNPFRTEHSPKDRQARFPDGSPNTLALTTYTTMTLTGATATSYHVQLSGPSQFGAGGLHAVYGTEASNDAAGPHTTTIGQSCQEGAFADLFFTTAAIQAPYRIVAGGLHIAFTGNLTAGSGIVRFGHYKRLGICTAASGYHATNGIINTNLRPEVYQIREGGQTRHLMTHKGTEFNPPKAVWSSDALGDNGLMPMCMITGLDASSSITVTGVLYIEMEINPTKLPFAMHKPTGEKDLNAIVAFVAQQPITASGHSFSSFIKAVGTLAGKVFRFVTDNQDFRTVTGAMGRLLV